MGILNLSTQARRSSLGSPLYRESVGALNASASTVLDLAPEASSAARYAPFNFVQITNNSSQDVEVRLNQDDEAVLFVPANTIQTLDQTTAPAVRSIRVTNVGASATSASEVQIVYQRTVVTGETLLQRGARAVFGGSAI